MKGIRFLMAGLLVAGLVVMAEAQPGGGFGRGFGLGPAQLVQNETVQKDLKLTEEQVEKVKEWAKEYQAKQMENFKGLQDLSKEERQQKFASLAVEGRKTAYKDLAGVLKAEQVDRLKQIERQAAGINIFSNEETAEALKLTDAQKSKIKSITEEYQKDSRELFGAFGKGGKGAGGFDKEKFTESMKKREKLEKSAVADIEEALTADQRKTWKDLTGAAIDRSKLVPQFGAGGFGKGKAKAKD